MPLTSLKWYILSFLAAGIMACESGTPTPIYRLDGSTITADSLTTAVESLMREGEVHGLALSVFNRGEAVYQRTFGYKNYEEKQPLEDTTNIYGASLSKAVFSVLVMKLVEEGHIDLDTPLQSYLPKKIYEYEPLTRWHDDYSDLAADTLHQKITARMCLSHTSGFPNWRWFEHDQQLRVKFEPGSRYL
ncbi:MAG: serine hydrolase domain-containing protein, partial [Saprospiraceae bacterium]|nr:serine hydrolase domain-containing protein [Saprospiraceae bacterium]